MSQMYPTTMFHALKRKIKLFLFVRREKFKRNLASPMLQCTITCQVYKFYIHTAWNLNLPLFMIMGKTLQFLYYS